jgi:hypothetical protein
MVSYLPAEMIDEEGTFMHNVMTRYHVGKDGILKLAIPTEHTDTDIEVLVVYQIAEASDAQRSRQDLGWTPGFFERIIGGWQGTPLVREAQGEYEIRDELK